MGKYIVLASFMLDGERRKRLLGLRSRASDYRIRSIRRSYLY